jgi:hypothetical protein
MVGECILCVRRAWEGVERGALIGDDLIQSDHGWKGILGSLRDITSTQPERSFDHSFILIDCCELKEKRVPQNPIDLPTSGTESCNATSTCHEQPPIADVTN